MGEFVLGGEFGSDDAVPRRARLRDEIGEAVIALWPDNDVDHRRPRHDLPTLGLRDAAGYCDHRLAALGFPRLLGETGAAELGIDLLGGLLPDVAGVEDDEVGLVLVRVKA